MAVDDDPTRTDPQHYRVLWENEHIRVLAYSDAPGETTHPHVHPNSVMVALDGFRRRLHAGDRTRDVEVAAGEVLWVPAQRHSGENIGSTPTRAVFIELKGGSAGSATGDGGLGPER